MMTSEVFKPCHFLVNPGPFLRFCRYDVCACVNSQECLCSALATYAAACAARGVLLNWRSPSVCGKSHNKCKLTIAVFNISHNFLTANKHESLIYTPVNSVP